MNKIVKLLSLCLFMCTAACGSPSHKDLTNNVVETDSLDFMIVYYSHNRCHSYVSKHLDSRTQTDYHTFLADQIQTISQSPLVFLLYDGNPNSFIAVRKSVANGTNGYVRMFDMLQLIGWYKFRKEVDGIYKLRHRNRECEFDNFYGITEVLSCNDAAEEFFNDAYILDYSSDQDFVQLLLEACNAYKSEVIDSKESQSLLLDVLPFDIMLYGTDIIKKNTTVPTRSKIFDYSPRSYIILNFSSSQETREVRIPMNSQNKTAMFLDLSTGGNITINIIDTNNKERISSISLDSYY